MSQAASRIDPDTKNRDVLKMHRSVAFNPLDYPICSLPPDLHYVPSAWLGHVPFGMCLMALSNPRILVELGTQYGVSYCGFCQAIKTLGLSTRCFAVDTWQGDAHASFYHEDVLTNLRRHHDPAYSLFSELIRSTFDEALPRFQDGSIDVLHIDGFHTYEAVRHDFETWLPKMSDRGIMLFHDTEVRDRETFGVWRFWDEIKTRYPHFEFHHSHGLGVLAVGNCIPEEMQPYLTASHAEANRLRSYFRNLGDHLSVQYESELQKSNLAQQLSAKTEECNHIANQCRVITNERNVIADKCHALADESARASQEARGLRQQVAYYQQLRFRAADWMGRQLAICPPLYKLSRLMVRGAAAVRLKSKAALSIR